MDDVTKRCRGEEDAAWLAGWLDEYFERVEGLLDYFGGGVLVTKMSLLRTALGGRAEKYGKN